MTHPNSKKSLAKGETPNLLGDEGYVAFIRDIKQRIQVSQIKAAIKVNQELLLLYWDLGERIVAKQSEAKWGDGFLEQMSKDLLAAFPEMKGFSFRNLKHVRQWVRFWEPIGKQLVSQIPWGHNILILQKIKNPQEALFYIRKTIENNWSRAVLTHQIESGLYQRDGKAITNFEQTLPAPQSDLAGQMLKDPYCFDFLMLREKHDEKELENSLSDHLARFLLELGAGVSFLGRQYRIEVGGGGRPDEDGTGYAVHRHLDLQIEKRHRGRVFFEGCQHAHWRERISDYPESTGRVEIIAPEH